METKNVYLASKPRYEILDGLRGVAAVLVVAYHLFETYYGGGADQPINHGYLAVDFFFVLSGFVIGYAYDDRWDRMSTWNFFKRRLIRLHPMVIFGTLFGAVMFYFGSCSDISYPIYITHYPLIYMQMSWAESHKDAPLGMHIFVAVCIFFLAIGLAYAALKLYDLPVREWLKNHLFTKSTAK